MKVKHKEFVPCLILPSKRLLGYLFYCRREQPNSEYSGMLRIPPRSSSRWDATTNLPFHIYNIFVAQITKLKPSEHNSLHGQVRPHWQLRDLQFNTACQSDLFRFIYFCRTSDEWNLTEARGKIERKWQWISEINKQTKKWRICFCEGSAMPQSRTESNILRLRKHVTCVSGVHIARTNEHETTFQCLCFSHKQRVETGKEPKYGFCFPW